MSAIQTRTSRLAVTVEVTEGTPVEPSASSDYLAMQDDFSMDPGFQSTENAELKASLGQSKPIITAEDPTSGFSHYLRHSGVEGQAPNFHNLLTASFGTETVVATERDTVAASTTTAINVDTGEGTEFPRGRTMLIKNAAGGYEIRAVHSVAGDVISPSFALANAPASGVNLGKPAYYSPADSGHPTLTAWHYAGNGGAVQMTSGNRVTDISMDFTASDLINANFSLEGLEYYFDPIEISASETYIDYTDDDGTYAVQVSAKMYKDPHELAAAVAVALNGTATTETHTVVYSDSTGKFTIENTTGALLSMLWQSGANTANTAGAKLGFDIAADDTGALSYVSDNALSLATPQAASFDDSDPLAAKDNELFIGDQDDNTCVSASNFSASLSTSRSVIADICAKSGRSGSLFNSRAVTCSVSALLTQYEADYFRKFREGSEIRCQYNFGTKVAGNWVAGKSGALYCPSMTITSYSLTDTDGIFFLNMDLGGFVDSQGQGEVYLGFV